jgi:flavin-dependent dehydrogenase
MRFIGKGNLNGGTGNIFMLPKPGFKDSKDVFEVTIGSPIGDPTTLIDKMRYVTQESFASQWFKHANLIFANSAVLNFSTPLLTPVKGRTLVVGDAAAFIETFVQGALLYGRSAAKAVIKKIRKGKGFSEYINFWRDTYGYNQPGEMKKAAYMYGITRFDDSELDYIFNFTDREKHKGFYNEFNVYESIKEALFGHLDAIEKEKPNLAKKLENFLSFKQSTLEGSLEFGKAKTEKS